MSRTNHKPTTLVNTQKNGLSEFFPAPADLIRPFKKLQKKFANQNKTKFV